MRGPPDNSCLPAPSGKPAASGGILQTTQCTQVLCGAAGSGASGSSTMRARLFAPDGTPDHDSGGEILAPSQVYFAGILSPAANAVEVRVRAMTFFLSSVLE